MPSGLPFVGGLAPNQHCRLEDAPLDLLTTLGPLLQRLSEAVKSVPGVARTHFSRWGDGSEHFHLWALARPLGMMQGRGPMLAFWDDVLPRLPEDLQREHLRVVATAMAEGGGEAPGARRGRMTGAYADRAARPCRRPHRHRGARGRRAPAARSRSSAAACSPTTAPRR